MRSGSTASLTLPGDEDPSRRHACLPAALQPRRPAPPRSRPCGPGRGAVALETMLGHLQQESLGGGDPALTPSSRIVTIWPSTAS